MKKLKKWQLFTAAGAAIVVIGTGSVMMFSHPSTPDQAITKETPMVQTVKDGSIASSVLLTGKVTANQEQRGFAVDFGQCRRSSNGRSANCSV